MPSRCFEDLRWLSSKLQFTSKLQQSQHPQKTLCGFYIFYKTSILKDGCKNEIPSLTKITSPNNTSIFSISFIRCLIFRKKTYQIMIKIFNISFNISCLPKQQQKTFLSFPFKWKQISLSHLHFLFPLVLWTPSAELEADLNREAYIC